MTKWFLRAADPVDGVEVSGLTGLQTDVVPPIAVLRKVFDDKRVAS